MRRSQPGSWRTVRPLNAYRCGGKAKKHSVARAGMCMLCAWQRVFIKLSAHYHAWDMWAGAASSSLTRLGHIEVIFAGFTQHCVRREGYPVDPIALCAGGSGSMNVAFEWWEASRRADSLYLLYLGNRPDATSNRHNDVIMVAPFSPNASALSLLCILGTLFCMTHRRGVSVVACLPTHYSWSDLDKLPPPI